MVIIKTLYKVDDRMIDYKRARDALKSMTGKYIEKEKEMNFKFRKQFGKSELFEKCVKLSRDH